jgi:hypothetical protein
MNPLQLYRTIGVAVCGVGAIAIGTTLYLPAVAAQAYQHVIAPMITGSCSSTSPCDQETNTSSGPALKGISDGGNGVTGQTSFASTSSTSFHAGVLGQDISTSGTFDAGVFGKSSNGNGVEGVSASSDGVYALSTSGSAVYAQGNGNYSAFASSLNNDGTNSSTQNNSTTAGRGRSGVWGHDDESDPSINVNAGVYGDAVYGIAVQANSSNFIGLNAVGGSGNAPALSVVAGQVGKPTYLILACTNPSDSPCTASSTSEVFSLDNLGNVIITGIVRTSGSCSSGCIARDARAPSRRVVSYAPTQTVPSIEDYGEAQLVNGRAYVPLSPDFANVVDPQTGYQVYITPEGDNMGVYISQKTRAGFEVKEAQNGHSTFAFSYRIVAKPFGVNRPRLPMQVGKEQSS